MLSLSCPAWASGSAERVDAPFCPPVAIQARRSAVMTARVTVDAEGYPHAVLNDPKSLFAPAIRAAFARTRLSPADCAGAEFPIVFRFTIRGAETHQRETAAVFHAPGEFEVFARPFAVQWSHLSARSRPVFAASKSSRFPLAQIRIALRGEVSGATLLVNDGFELE